MQKAVRSFEAALIDLHLRLALGLELVEVPRLAYKIFSNSDYKFRKFGFISANPGFSKPQFTIRISNLPDIQFNLFSKLLALRDSRRGT